MTNPKTYKERVNEIEEKAKQTLIDHSLYSIPVDPVILANKLGVRVSNALFNDENISGMISKRDKETSILVNIKDKPFRKRFTIAHELGHKILHLDKSNDDMFVDNSIDLFRDIEVTKSGEFKEEKAKEVEANKFAAALLMPEEFVINEYGKTKNLEKLAEIFKVSEPAMAYRLNQLEIN